MKKNIIRIIISTLLLISGLVINTEIIWLKLGVFILSYLIIGIDVVFKALKNICKGKLFDEHFLMSIATIGAFTINQYPEAVTVMLLYQVGELFQDYAVDKSRTSITELMDIRPDYANRKRGNIIEKVSPCEIKTGDIIIVRAGEKVPLDGVVIEGNSMLDTSALTGESVPQKIDTNDNVLSGCINLNSLLTIRVTKKFAESTVSKILNLVENASSKKAKSENFITKFSSVYTPVVVISAILLAVIPPLFIQGELWSNWVYRALTFLVVSCPCALVISVPLGFFGGIGGASKTGVLVKGGNYLEALAKTEIAVFDKTGTLTQGTFDVQEMFAKDISKQELLKTAAYAESYSNHPISLSLKKAYGKEIDNTVISNAEEISGHGMSVKINGNDVLVGNAKLMKKMNINYEQANTIGTVVYVAVNGVYKGYVVIADKIKDDAVITIKQLKSLNVKQTVMLTGDNKAAGENVSKKIGIDKTYTNLLPMDKMDKLEDLFTQKSKKGKLIFVGDGINDAPVLARADVGIAMGGLGSDAAIEAADVVIMNDKPSKIVTVIKTARKTLDIVNQNIIFALIVKISVLLLSAFGIANMWEAVFADVGVSVIAVLNSLRTLKVKEQN